jgi:threonine aldolase
MVYISFPTETGMLYTKQELTALSAICRQYELPLYIDGARLGYGLMAPAADITLRELAALADVMYIGGTKQGALFGEALVVCNPKYRKDLRYLIKQSGGMLAKGRLIGIQFLTLMQNDLYWQLAAKAVRQALSIRQALLDKGYRMASESPTNQQFVIIADDKLNELKTRYLFDYCERVDEAHSMVRICTSWATRDEDVTQLIHDL